jgi:hypothetical protein
MKITRPTLEWSTYLCAFEGDYMVTIRTDHGHETTLYQDEGGDLRFKESQSCASLAEALRVARRLFRQNAVPYTMTVTDAEGNEHVYERG